MDSPAQIQFGRWSRCPPDGVQLADYFSRVAILKEDVFFAEDVVISADITWDDNDSAGLYIRFNGESDDPPYEPSESNGYQSAGFEVTM